MAAAGAGDETELGLDEDDDDEEDDLDDGWGTGGLRDRLLGGPPLGLLVAAAVLFGLGVLEGVSVWKQYEDFDCVTSVFGDGSGDDGCDTDRWQQLGGFLGGASQYVLAATLALVGHAFLVARHREREPRP
jgi:hypothetical protein